MIRKNFWALALVASCGLAPCLSSAQGALSSGLSGSTAAMQALAASAAAQQASQLSTPLPIMNLQKEDKAPPPEYPPVKSDLYGQWLFSGNFARQSFSAYNPDYLVGVGDIIDLRFWGGFDFQAQMEVDSQGQIFVARLGPIRVEGVRNGDLNRVLRGKLRTIFRDEVGVYASLAVAQPVKVFVGGGVVRPGLYDATASDSLLHFLDRAGGIEPEAGSYRRVQVLRDGQLIRQIDLYEFLTDGILPLIQLRDGDTIFVRPRGAMAKVDGLVAWGKRFELNPEEQEVQSLLALAQLDNRATHVRITRQAGASRQTLVYSLAEDLSAIAIEPGDSLEVYADRPYSTVLVRIDGEHAGNSQIVLPYGASVEAAMDQIQPTVISDLQNVRLFRLSVAERQKVVIDQLLDKLEESVLTARSDTAQEAALRTQEAQLILKFVDRARAVEARGQVVFRALEQGASVILEEGDRLEVPRKSHLVGVHGEVYLPASFGWEPRNDVADYIRKAGGLTQSGARDRILLMKPNGAVVFARAGGFFGGTSVSAGDEILVLPRVDAKGFQMTKDVVEVIYQIAVAAGVLVRL